MAYFALIVFFEVALLEKKLDEFRVLVVEMINLTQNVVAIFEEVLGDLVEDIVGGEGPELLGTVPFGEFEKRHGFVILSSPQASAASCAGNARPAQARCGSPAAWKQSHSRQTAKGDHGQIVVRLAPWRAFATVDGKRPSAVVWRRFASAAAGDGTVRRRSVFCCEIGKSVQKHATGRKPHDDLTVVAFGRLP